MTKFYLEYPLVKGSFKEEEFKVLELLKEAGKKVGELFERQVGSVSLPGANFYPHDATREEIEKASKSDPKIFDPYTVVKRDSKGKLYAVYYHDEYKQELEAVSDIFIKASKIVANASFKKYLETAAHEFLHGDYDKLEISWLAIDDLSFLHLMTGPIGSYADRLFSLKKAYNFNLTYKSTDQTFNPSNYVEVTKNILPPFGSRARQNVPAEKIKVRVDNVACIAGRNAALPARAVNYPEDIEKIQKHGIKIVVYTNNIEKRDRGMLIPLLRDILDKGVLDAYDDYFLMSNAVRLVMSHEITEAVFQYPGAWERLKGMFNYVYELHSSIVGIKACGFQVIKGVLSQKDLEAILYIMLMRTFSDYYVRKTAPQVENYLAGYRVFYNYCLEAGAIKLQGKTILPNASKMYACADQIANVVMHLYAEGTEEEAKEFFDKYTSEYMYDYFKDKLSEYNF